MPLNVERFKNALAALQEEGEKLELSLLLRVHGAEKLKAAFDFDDKEVKGFERLPKFNSAYEGGIPNHYLL